MECKNAGETLAPPKCRAQKSGGLLRWAESVAGAEPNRQQAPDGLT